MNRIGLILVLLLANLSVLRAQEKPIVTLTFEVEGKAAEDFTLTNSRFEPIRTISYRNQGVWQDTFHLPHGYYFLTYQAQQVRFFMHTGESLKLSFNVTDLVSTLNYEGTGAPASKYLLAKQKLTQNLPVEVRSYAHYALLSEEAYLSQIDSIAGLYQALFEQEKPHLSTEFIKLETQNLAIDHALNIAQFQSQKRFVTEDPTFEVSADYPDAYSGIDLNDPTLLCTYNYEHLLHTYFDEKSVQALIENPGQDFFVLYLKELKSSGFHPEIIDLLGVKNAEVGFSYTADAKTYTETFLSYATLPGYIQTFQSYARRKQQEAGKPSPDFSFEDQDGKLHTLKEYAGKPIYLDIWATWCGPCVKQMPHLKALEAELGEKINFISVAFKDQKASWKKMVQAKALTGVQLFASEGNEAFFSFYDLNKSGVPRFILLDASGNIIESQARQPSDKALAEQLRNL